MTQGQAGAIRITPRAVHARYEVYPLAAISRVAFLQVEWVGKYSTYYPLRRVPLLVLAIALASPLAFPGNSGGTPLVPSSSGWHAGFLTIFSLLVLWLLILLGVALYRAGRPPRYALIIETAGAANAMLSSVNPDEVGRIWYAIVYAIENPPATDQVVQYSGDIVLGDKVGGDKILGNAVLGSA